MQYRILYNCYKFFEARTFPLDGTLIVATVRHGVRGSGCPVHTAVQMPLARSGPVLNSNILYPVAVRTSCARPPFRVSRALQIGVGRHFSR